MRTWVAPVIAAVLLGPARGARADVPPPSRVAALTQAEAEALARDVSAKVEAIRGMKFKTPITVKIIGGADARAEFKSNISSYARRRSSRSTTLATSACSGAASTAS